MRKFGLIGYPLGHSFSPSYFAKKFEKLGIDDCTYSSFELEELGNLKELIRQENISGLNVTIPYKQEVFKCLDWIEYNAVHIGAVNTIKVIDGKLLGYNTDYLGFLNSIAAHLNLNDKALVFGTGGSSKAIVYALQQLNIENTLVSSSNTKVLNYNQLKNKDVEDHRLLINTTPLGMYPKTEDCVDIPYEAISQNHICYDLVYNPQETKFLQLAQALGASTFSGKKMLENQADLSWNIWNA